MNFLLRQLPITGISKNMSASLNNADDDEYNGHWEQLKVALDTVLLNVPGSYPPISYEQVRSSPSPFDFHSLKVTVTSFFFNFITLQMYSAVYKCVCKHFAERLHADLCQHVLQVIQRWSTDLLQLSQAEDDKMPFLVKTDYFLTQFSNALSSIVPLFTYLVRFFLFGLIWIYHEDFSFEFFRIGFTWKVDLIATSNINFSNYLFKICQIATSGIFYVRRSTLKILR